MRVKGLILGLALASISQTKSYSKDRDAVLLSNVRTLTVHKDKMTSARRVSAVPQLTCVGGNAKGLYGVDVMRCKNSGSEYDAEDIQWTCQASLPPEFKLGGTEVVCEGYDSPEDPWVLKGSCGVEYRLVLTDEGYKKYAKRQSQSIGPGRGDHSRDSQSGRGDLFAFLFWLAFIAVVGLILYSIFNAPAAPRNPGRNIGLGGGGWGGGGGDDNDPPPPYTPRAQPRPKSSSSRSSSASSKSSGPGFWSGVAGGAAAGYAAGRYMGGRNQQHRPPQPPPAPQPLQAPVAGPSNSWFGDGNTGSSYSLFGDGGAGPSNYGGGGGGSSSSSSAPPPSSSRYESTGFGGTRRR